MDQFLHFHDLHAVKIQKISNVMQLPILVAGKFIDYKCHLALSPVLTITKLLKIGSQLKSCTRMMQT